MWRSLTKLFVISLLWIQTLQAGDWKAPYKLIDSIKTLSDSLAPEAKLGLSVYSLQRDSLLYSINDLDDFTPASTLKILVTSAALDIIPTDWAPRNTWLLEGSKTGSHFKGRLTWSGGGDPNLSARYFPEPLSILKQWSDSLKHEGIDTISGKIVLDESYFSGPRRPSTWEKRFFDRWYGAEISALTFNDNCLLMKVIPGEEEGDTCTVEFEPDLNVFRIDTLEAVTTKGKRRSIQFYPHPDSNIVYIKGEMGVDAREYSAVIPVRNPKSLARAALLEAFRQSGITVDTTAPTDSLLEPWGLYQWHTAPLLSLLDEINQRSQNLHAEILLRHLGYFFKKEGNLENGLAAEKDFLKRMGFNPDEFTLLDGSGLSYGNKVKPRNMALLLKKMSSHPQHELFRNSLGLPGITGATGKRLRGTPNAHKIRVKTGFVNEVQGLAGYIATSDSDTLAAALYLNGYKINTKEARELMDTLWTFIADFHNQEAESLKDARRLWYSADSIKDLHQRMDFFSKALLERPYMLGPTGEGWSAQIERKPLFETRHFDCVTFIEHVMALAYSKAPDSLLSTLTKIRYEDGIPRYQNRKHYFVEDWIRKSPEWVEEIYRNADSSGQREMDKKGFYKSKGIPYKSPNPKTLLKFTPLDSAIKYADEWEFDDPVLGVAFVHSYQKIWVSHTGFLIHQKGKPLLLRHASSKHKEVHEEPLTEYLKSRKGKAPGIMLFRFKP
jgi:D-alanyl-D-alanine carboxypeptidase/D-alanyl-D-alanine-endopeptidase (penicillin-binding protein 4)